MVAGSASSGLAVSSRRGTTSSPSPSPSPDPDPDPNPPFPLTTDPNPNLNPNPNEARNDVFGGAALAALVRARAARGAPLVVLSLHKHCARDGRSQPFESFRAAQLLSVGALVISQAPRHDATRLQPGCNPAATRCTQAATRLQPCASRHGTPRREGILTYELTNVLPNNSLTPGVAPRRRGGVPRPRHIRPARASRSRDRGGARASAASWPQAVISSHSLPLRRRRLQWLFTAPKALAVAAPQRVWRAPWASPLVTASVKLLHSGACAAGQRGACGAARRRLPRALPAARHPCAGGRPVQPAAYPIGVERRVGRGQNHRTATRAAGPHRHALPTTWPVAGRARPAARPCARAGAGRSVPAWHGMLQEAPASENVHLFLVSATTGVCS